MDTGRWHQGLYRRVVIGCVALVVVILAVEAGLFALVNPAVGQGRQ